MSARIYRGTFAIVDASAIAHNVAAFRKLLQPHVRLLVAVKADGYGHGAVTAARAALAGGATDLGVASLEEALALREAGVTAPVLVLGPVHPWMAETAARHDIAVTLSDDPDVLEGLHFDSPLRVHLKVDTGMTRLGLSEPEEVVRAARKLRDRSDILWQGVFTHIACADAPDAGHAERQVERFERVLAALRTAGLEPPIVHAANSAATVRNPSWHYDMVRIGISAYGYAPSPDFAMPFELRPALNLYSFITRVRWIQPGETVGYGATFTARRPTRVATVAVGYADGYPRILSNRASVLVRGKTVPVIGRVCMDQLMIDVTEVEGVEAGDCVTLYGRAAPQEWRAETVLSLPADAQVRWLADTFRQSASAPLLSLDELAAHASTISYELMCALAARVPRIVVGAEMAAH